jgi:hypothetical protein
MSHDVYLLFNICIKNKKHGQLITSKIANQPNNHSVNFDLQGQVR